MNLIGFYRFIASAVILWSSAAPALTYAQGITLYGILDAGVRVDHNASGKTIAVNSGQFSSSRWGMRGSEDLGGGFKANFLLESGFLTDTGVGTNGAGLTFNRGSTVGLSSDRLGAVNFGRQYTSVFTLASIVDPLAIGLVGNTVNSFGLQNGLPGRMDNSVLYNSPIVNGFKGELGYAFGESSTAKASSEAGSARSFAVSYLNGPFFIGSAYFDSRGTKDVSTLPKQQRILLGATYDFSFLKLHSLFGANKNNAVGSPQIDRDNYAVGVTIPVLSTGRVILQHQGSSDNTTANANMKQNSISFDYFVSRRTDLYVSAARTHNTGSGAFGISDAGSSNPGTVRVGSSPNAFQFGIRHRF